MSIKTYSVEEMKKILADHSKWWNGQPGGVRANLRSADLHSADLHSADLGGADLGGADLHSADLGGANLHSADLRSANLHSADLHSADLRSADLRSADLHSADLGGADLGGANLGGADLGGANLGGANLKGVKGFDAISPFQIVPEEGAFIGWKKVRRNVILKLLIPADASRVSTPIGRKCRASSVQVLEATLDGKPFEGDLVSQHDSSFTYRVGKVAVAPSYDPSITVECTGGIHFFITRQEALDY